MKVEKMGLVFRESEAAETVLTAMKQAKALHATVLSPADVPAGVIRLPELIQLPEISERTAADIMSRDFTVISESADWEAFLQEDMNDKRFPLVVVNEAGQFKGCITESDFINILSKNLKYTKRILDNLDEGIVAVDAENNIAYMNEPWKQIHSIKDNKLIGESVMKKFPETKLGDVNVEQSELGGQPIHLNFTGATVLPSYRAITDDEKQSLGAMAIVKDYGKINNLYIGINKINRLNLLFTSIFNHLRESVFYVDKNFRIVYANKEFIRTFDAKPGELMPDSEVKKLIRDKYKLDRLDSFNKELILTTEEGRKNISIVGIPIVDAGQSLEGLVIILQDVTGLKNLNYEVEKRGHLLEYYKEQINKIPDELICESEAFKEVISTALKVASTNASVLIEGENGVGKELIANLIHNNSARKEKPFIPVNCGAIPDALWESEMFGYEDGAFTGAKKGGKAGIFEMADEGTVFLDEIGELSLPTQVKMLRFLQNMEIAKVGRKEVKKIDVRIIAATNKNLKRLVEEEAFRMDLYYRLNVIKLEVPALRARVDEIQPLTEKFIAMFNERYNKQVSISREALELLKKEKWPGNIRQLRNTIEQSVIMCDCTIQPYDLPLDNGGHVEEDMKEGAAEAFTGEERWNLPARIQALEKELIKSALQECNYNKSKVIELLHISRKTFYKKIKDYDL